MSDLNSAQQRAIEHTSGPLIIVAGAGTGKTTVITQKIAYLIDQKLATSEQILALTFTEKAAHEMVERVDKLLSIGYADLQISTFHAFCQRLLEQYGLDIGLPNRFKVLTETEAWLLVRQNLKRFNLDYYRPMANPTRHIHELIKHFSKCKDELITPERYIAYAEEKQGESGDMNVEEKNRLTEIANAYHTYNQLLLENDSLDFGDLIFYTHKLLSERPNILQALQKRFRYILVDEFQDVNWSQYQLVRLLTAPPSPLPPPSGEGENDPPSFQEGVRGSLPQLTVVGDDDQSIYAFRGASVSNILRFKDDHPDTAEIVLTENFRSNQTILDASYKLIQNNNPDRLEVKLNIDKRLVSKKESFKKNDKNSVEYLRCSKLDDEVQTVISKIQELKANNPDLSWSDNAILVRANNHAEPFITALEKARIPYEFLASAGLFRQRIVIDALNFFKVINSYHESSAIFRLLLLPLWKFSENDLQKFTFVAKKKSISYYETLKRVREFGLSDSGIQICDKLVSLIHDGMRQTRDEKPSKILYGFLENSGYLKYLSSEEAQNTNLLQQIHFLNQFFEHITEYETTHPDHARVTGFLEYYNYLVQAGEEGPLETTDGEEDMVKVMTVHAAKGLEFKNVFIVNLVEERFPTRRRGDSIEMPEALINEQLPSGDAHYQEERRLFYVALTRAKEKLFLLSSDDYGGVREKKVSRFVAELGLVPEEKKVKKTKREIKVQPTPLQHEFEELQKNISPYTIPEKFSFSQIKSYETCPYQYKLAHILKVPTKGSPYFSFGQTIHSTLQKFYERIQELNAVKQVSLFGTTEIANTVSGGVKVPSVDDLLKIYDQVWIEDWYNDQNQREEYYEKGKKILKEFYTTHDGQWTIPVALEGWFKIKVGQYLVHGRIDRIDKLPDGTLEIIDYKTGKAKEKVTGEDKDQLLIYQMATEQLSQYRHMGVTQKLTFYYINDNIKVSFLGSQEELVELQEKLIGVIEKIHAGNFEASPSSFICGTCDFKDICDYRMF